MGLFRLIQYIIVTWLHQITYDGNEVLRIKKGCLSKYRSSCSLQSLQIEKDLKLWKATVRETLK